MTHLIYTTTLPAPICTCFDLVRSIETHCATASGISARAIGGRCSGLSEIDDETRWSARFFGMRFELTTRISEYERPFLFSDELVSGPFRAFGHRYEFRELSSDETLFVDRFHFESPYRLIGKLIDRFVLKSQLEKALRARGKALRLLAAER